MRILLVTPLYFPSLAGAAVYFDLLGRHLRRLEPAANITILTPAVPGAAHTEHRDGIAVRRWLPPPRFGRAGAGLAALLVLALSRRLRSDVVHYHTLASYRGLHVLAPRFRAHLVGDMRDLAVQHEGARIEYYTRCARLICASENILGHLRARGFPPDKLVHIPVPFVPLPSVDAAAVAGLRERHGIPAGVPYVLYLGALVPAKGVPELLAAMELVWRRAPDLHLVLAGARAPGTDPTFDRRLGACLTEERRVRHVGAVGRADVATLLQGAEVFILPSRTEGLPRSCLEAFSLGKKAILPPGVPEFERACPEAVLSRIAPETIADAIDATLRGGRPPAYPLHHHDAETIARRTLELYRSLDSG